MSSFRWLVASLVLCGFAFAQEKPPTQKELRDICKFVEKTRGLQYKSEVPAGVKTVEEVKQMFTDEMKKTMPDEKLAGVQKAMVKLGLLPGNYDLKTHLADFYSQAVAAFYDPETKKLYLIDRTEVKEKSPLAALNDMMMKMLGVKENLMICAHELTHALQDQNFDLTTMPMEMDDNDDEVTAVKSLVEGEANLVMYEYVGQKMGSNADGFFQMSQGQLFSPDQQTGSKEVDEAPAILRQGAMFPYTVGLHFVDQVRAKGGWEAVSKVFDDPPESTEQVLHPEKYLAERDNPIAVTVPDLAKHLAGWKELTHNVMGEFQMQVMFRAVMPNVKKKSIEKACSGWGGDTYYVYERPKDGRVLLVWATNWDTEDAADGFATAYRKLLAKKYGKLSEVESNDTLYVADTESDGRLGVERNGKDVLIIEGCDPDQGQPLGQAIWKGLKKTEIKHLDRVKASTKNTNDTKEEKHVDAPKESAKGGVRLSTNGFDVSFDAPKGWSHEVRSNSTAAGSRSECDLTSPGGTDIRVIAVKGDADPADTLKETADRVHGMLRGANAVKAKTVQVAGHDGREAVIEGKDGDTDFRARVVSVGADKGVVTFVLLGPADSADADGKAFQAVLDSLHVK